MGVAGSKALPVPCASVAAPPQVKVKWQHWVKRSVAVLTALVGLFLFANGEWHKWYQGAKRVLRARVGRGGRRAACGQEWSAMVLFGEAFSACLPVRLPAMGLGGGSTRGRGAAGTQHTEASTDTHILIRPPDIAQE